jgi:hypothetical protein
VCGNVDPRLSAQCKKLPVFMESAMLFELERLGFCLALLAMLLGIAKSERRIRRWSLRYPRRRANFKKHTLAFCSAEMSFGSAGTGEI